MLSLTDSYYVDVWLFTGGNIARPVTRLSFRKNKKFGIFGVKKKKTTDERGLMDRDAISNAGNEIYILTLFIHNIYIYIDRILYFISIKVESLDFDFLNFCFC